MTIDPQMESHLKLFMPRGTAVATFPQVSTASSKTLPEMVPTSVLTLPAQYRRVFHEYPHCRIAVISKYWYN